MMTTTTTTTMMMMMMMMMMRTTTMTMMMMMMMMVCTRSVGVVVYVLLSGVSPFLDETLDQTCEHIRRRDFCFPDTYFVGISGEAKDFIDALLVLDKRYTMSYNASVEN